MAPEQAKGKGADRATDVWSFGIVLYEMITGSRMFGGDTVPETLASVMKDQVDAREAPRGRPSAIRKLLGRCLERDPRRRLQSIGEARIVIDDVMTGVAADENRPSAATPAHVAKWPLQWQPWGAGCGVSAGMGLDASDAWTSGCHALHANSAGERCAHGHESQRHSDGCLTGRPLCRLRRR